MFITKIKKSILMVSVAVCGIVGVVRTESASACASLPVVVDPTYTLGASTLFPPVELRSTDPVGPFPLSALVPFPWTTIEGIWTMKMPDGTSLYFSFEVGTACDGRKIVKVTGFDQKSYRVTAEGVGIGLANDTMVRAVMTSATTQFMVFIRQFKLPAPKAAPSAPRAPGKISTVVTVRPFSGDETDDVHMIARKASTLTLTEYLTKQHEDQERRQAEIRRRMSASGRP